MSRKNRTGKGVVVLYKSQPHEDQLGDPENLPGAETQPDATGSANSFARWAAASGRPSSKPSKASAQPVRQSRRKLISLIAIGTVALATGATGIGISHAEDIDGWVRRMRGENGQVVVKSHQSDNHQSDNHQSDNHQSDDHESDDKHKNKPPTQQTPQPTQQPTQPPVSTGTVIGSANMAPNSSMAFKNPANGQQAILVRMANGKFTAATSACTHQGVTVAWDPATQTLLCPAHGATFNPATGFSATLPARTPLTAISVHVSGANVVTP
jgi:Rieske Fe-S protein